MRWLLALYGLLGLFGLALAGDDWMLDSSCKTDAYEGPVGDAMEKAFKLAEGLLDTFDKVANDQPFEKHGDEIRNVLKWMFLPKDAEVNADSDFGRVKNKLKGILEHRQRNDEGHRSSHSVIVYCDEKRWKKVPTDQAEDGQRWKDDDLGIFDKDPFEECKDFTTMAYLRDNVRNGFKANQMQICPKWLELEISQRDKKCDKWCWARIADNLVDKLRAPIDKRNELESTLLHELTHTKSGESTDDVYSKKWTRLTRYGWRRCHKLANEGHAVGADESPQNNADTIALAAVAVAEIKDDNSVDEKGNLDIDGLKSGN